MRLGWTKTKYSVSFYVQKTVYVDGKNKSMVVKRLGSEKQIREIYGVTDAKAWAQEQVRLMNEAEKEDTMKFTVELSPSKDLPSGEQRLYNGGYLFLQKIYHDLGIDRICTAVKNRSEFEYNLNSILSRLLYTRILYPSSKLSSFEESKRFLEQPDFELHQIYRALSVLASESDYIQSRLFKNSMKLSGRHTDVIYYDCTNFYFEIDGPEDDKQFGISKENRSLPIVGMGLFMDRDGIPLAFSIHPGNENEQQTLIPLEKKLGEDFGLSKFIVCTDAGLSSGSNRVYNDYFDESSARAFITVQSLKKLKEIHRNWALDPGGWKLMGDSSPDRTYRIDELDETGKDHEKVFYKSKWIREMTDATIDGKHRKTMLDQQIVVSYSLKYRDYQRNIRDGQVRRAEKALGKGEGEITKKRPNDPKRFIRVAENADEKNGENEEKKEKKVYVLDEDLISEEAMYDGFYALCTNLDDSPEIMVRINRRRWEIEECFRIMKSEFQARPVYLKRKERILAHFITCFMALIIYRYLEMKLDNRFTCEQILSTLREMNFLKYEGKGYQPTYTRTDLTDALHDAFGFCTSKEIVPVKTMKKICADTKKPEK